MDTRWTLVDTTCAKIVRHVPEEIDRHWNPEVEWELSQLVPKAETLTPAGIRKAGYSVCDTNRHINKRRPIWMWPATRSPLRCWTRGPIRSAAIKYHRQVPMGEEMELFYGPAAGKERGWLVCDGPPGGQGRL